MNRELAKEVVPNITYHYFNSEGGGVATVAVANNDDRTQYYTGLAYCSPEDKFVKATGRNLALRRLIDHIHACCQNTLAERYEGNRHLIAKHVANREHSKPQWAKHQTFEPRKQLKEQESSRGDLRRF